MGDRSVPATWRRSGDIAAPYAPHARAGAAGILVTANGRSSAPRRHQATRNVTVMTTSHRPPFNLMETFPEGYRAVRAFDKAVAAGPLDHTLFELVKLRASQINGCAYCIDMHHKDLRAEGESEERLYMLPAWREATVYSDTERAALGLTEAITLIAGAHVPEDVEAEARRLFDAESYAALVFAIALINTWNRLAITAHSEPGHYQPRRATAAR